MGYYFYYPLKNKVLVAQNAEFFENCLITQEASGSLEDRKIIQKEDMHPSVNTSSHHDEDDQEIDEPQSDINPIHRSIRIRHAPDPWDNFPSYSSLHASQHNGVSKRRNRTLLDMVEKTPYKVWHGQAPKVYYLKFWDYEVLVKRDTLPKPDKLEPRSIKCIVVGYPKETMGYYFYYPLENKVLVAQNAEFFENCLITQEASRSLEDHKIIQEEDMHPSVNTSSHHDEDDQEIDEPQSDINPIHRSIRIRHAPDRDMKRELSISCYTDAGYLTDDNDLKSQTGYKPSIFLLITLLRKLFGLENLFWGVVPTIEETIKMYFANIRAITIANKSRITKGARYFRAKVYYLCEVTEFNDVKLEKLHTDDNLADPFTKALPFPKHSVHTKNIGMLPASSLM
nr:hypothetical protein [Tanacetum cinerariifolium]